MARTLTSQDIAAAQVEALYRYADALGNAQKAMNNTTVGLNAEFDALVDVSVYPDDLGDLGKRVHAIADAWQARIDAELAAAEEAEDRRRANLLEPSPTTGQGAE